MLRNLDFMIAYLDDILMNSQNIEQHKEHVHEVFSRIQEYSFKLKESKSNFFIEKIKYLGHSIDKDGRRPDPTAINNMPAPQSFLGLANYYQMFIPNMYNLHVPLNKLLKKTKTGSGLLNVRKHSEHLFCSRCQMDLKNYLLMHREHSSLQKRTTLKLRRSH